MSMHIETARIILDFIAAFDRLTQRDIGSLSAEETWRMERQWREDFAFLASVLPDIYFESFGERPEANLRARYPSMSRDGITEVICVLVSACRYHASEIAALLPDVPNVVQEMVDDGE